MSACEKCWSDAYGLMMCNPEKSQSEHYHDLIKKRENNPCSKLQQIGKHYYESNDRNDLCKRCDEDSRHTIHIRSGEDPEEQPSHDVHNNTKSHMKVFDSFISEITK